MTKHNKRKMNYQLTNETNPNAMRLQSVGLVVGTPAKEIKKGTVLMWNFGQKSEVVEVLKETAKTIVIETKSESGYIGTRRLNKQRLVCILEPTKQTK